MMRSYATNPSPECRDSSMMECWQDKHLTEAQRDTLRTEYVRLQSFIFSLPETATLVDAGCGDARVLARIGLGTRRYIGVDIDPNSVKAARESCAGIQGAHVLEPQDYRKALQELASDGPIATLCLGGTLGSFPGDEREHLRALTHSSCAFFFTVWHNSLEVTHKRIDYYLKNHLDFGVQWDKGVIVSRKWGAVRSWTQEELGSLCRTELSRFDCYIVETLPLAWTVMGYRKE